MNKKINKKELLMDSLGLIIGSILFALSIDIFTEPNDLAPGGIIGISTILHSTMGITIGWSTILMNIPLFVWAYKKAGSSFFIKTVFVTIFSSILMEAIRPFIKNMRLEYKGDLVLTSVIGGILCGAGLAFIFMRGGTSGGVDIAANLISMSMPHVSIGKALLIIDAVIISASAFIYTLEKAFYAAIFIFVSTQIIDVMMYGVDIGNGKVMFIVSSKNQEIGKKVIEDLGRGVTELRSRGYYTKKEGEMLMCVVKRYEVHKLRMIVNSVDSSAFMIVTDAKEITGEGFKEINVK